MTTIEEVHASVAARRAEGFASLAEFRAAWLNLARVAPTPVDSAIVGGALADRLGYAFAAGYRAALACLLPELPITLSACLCITEEGGAHPRAIRTVLLPDGDGGFVLNGRKQWATLAGDGEVLLVAASVGTDGDRNLLRLVRVDPRAAGVTVVAMPPTPFTPEIPHYTLTFEAVRVASGEVIQGDAWDRYIKPFRTVEDAHVCVAAMVWLDGVARSGGWPLRDRLAALIATLRDVALAPPDDPVTHVRLGDALATMNETLAACDPLWERADPEVAARWRRDAPLLGVATRARQQRLAVARQRLGLAGA